ncbi:sigma 54-interacting transcriptional regulator [Fusibacter paucivorans]|uniref:Sigma 54-interacting transcriptional regulator n=1 Tax=Fusibacter paucivorans TaxID=76009 RepID=A0ABS5PMG1_9FIRM|nr:sigma 54-interacting transcriptional regulator [Fusibacter paucivorans]MBS7526248.1 sigma 54-interacting transcriptional regulator [Fusibacter paucivorans]
MLNYEAFDHLPFDHLHIDTPVEKWMTPEPYVVHPYQTLKEATDLLNAHHIYSVPVVSDQRTLLGLITKSTLIQAFFKSCNLETPVSYVMETEFATISPKDKIDKAIQMRDGCLPVVDSDKKLLGIITRTDILKANAFYLQYFRDTIDHVEILKLVLNSAYEGVVVIDQTCKIIEFNEAYCRFVGKSRDAIIGKDVREVIENTRLHIVVKNGTEERGFIQRIQGHDMIVHRIPIFNGKKVVGAIGMLIFQDVTQLYHILGRVHDARQKPSENEFVFSERDLYHLNKIIGTSAAMLSAKRLAKKAAVTPATVLITGESGTGKEVFAQAIHDMSAFSDGPLISVNCAAIPENLLETELFGYEEGAFTDARRGGKPGRFEQADNGTIFLDEIGDMPLLMQAKILRVLQERVVERVGGTNRKKINVRIIAATNRDMESMVESGQFREDLYYRINIIRLHLPPLRERTEDIPKLINHFIHQYSSAFGIAEKKVSKAAMLILQAYNWHGNVREIINLCEMLVCLTEQAEISPEDLPKNIRHKVAAAHQLSVDEVESNIKAVMDQQEKLLILETLKQTSGNKAAAARLLNIQRSTLYMKMKKHNLQ